MKKNYFLRTAILLVALLCGANAGWAETFTKISTLDELTDGKYVIAYGTTCAMNNTNAGKYFNPTDISPVDGSILNPDASIVWDIKTTEAGSTISNGDIFVYCSGEKNVSAKTWADGDNKFYWTFTESEGEFIAQSVGSSIALYLKYNPSNPRFTTYKSGQQNLTLYKLQETGKSNPNLTFTGITGDVTKQLTDGTYSSAATSASDATIVYSSSNTDVATIDQAGLVTLVAGGTTTIKAEVAETASYEAAFVEYTLKVVDPALVKTFTKVTNGSVTDGQYIIVYQESDEATSVRAMNTTNTKDYFMYTDVNLTEGKIVTDDQSIIWDITTESDGNYSVSNNGIYVAYNGSNAEKGNNNAYADEAYSTERAGWKIEYDSENHVFLFKNAKVDTRILQFNTNANQGRFACYRSAQGKITLYKLDEGPATGVENVDVANGMKVINGKGKITIVTDTPASVAIYALTGAQVRQIELVEGDNVVTLPAGIYVINRQKVIVF